MTRENILRAGPALLRAGAAALASALIACTFARADPAAPADELQLAIILTRHSVRSPLATNEAMAGFAGQPWPKWEVAPGIQTPHGNSLAALMGDYYRARLTAAGALSGDPAVDGPDVHALGEGMADPLFRPLRARVGHPDAALAVAAVLGRVGGDPSRVDRAYAAQLAELKAILFGPAGAPQGPSPFNAPACVVPGGWDHLVTLKGPIYAASQCTESLLLEYT